MRMLIPIAIMALFLTAVPVNADEHPCPTDDSAIDVAGVYVREDADGVIWLYQESNGVAGLQYGAAGSPIHSSSEVAGCVGGDTLIY